MLEIPLNRLPLEPEARHGALRDYFCDKDATAERVGKNWRLQLHWPDGFERHVDPHLDIGLAWWGDGVRRGTMGTAQRRQGRVLTVLYDTWTLASWSTWLAARTSMLNTPFTILHVDDHQDLGSPRMVINGETWIDAITGEHVDLANPASVVGACLSGAIGMGSFLTPFLHRLPLCQVRHLCQPPKARTTADYDVVSTTVQDTLLRPGAPRPAISLVPGAQGPGPGRYRITPDINAWLEHVGDAPALLHIDMDYFNNRYDGDTDWQYHAERLDPPIEVIIKKIDELVGALTVSPVRCRIADIVIAYSPGFFPAEFWQVADERLRRGLQPLNGT